MKKLLGIVATLLFILPIGYGIWHSTQGKDAKLPAVAGGVGAKKCQTYTLLTGSAKFGFLQDQRVEEILLKNEICLNLIKSGAFAKDSLTVKELDAAWPAGANAASDFASLVKGNQTYPVFSSPLAIASWSAIEPLMIANGVATKNTKGIVQLELDKVLPIMLKGTRWKDLAGNQALPSSRSILVNTPDTRKSNTGVLWVSLLAYSSSGANVAQTVQEGELVADRLAPLITKQGFQEGTLAGPFEDYIGQGMGKAPMVLVYESQFFEAKQKGQLTDKHILMYPNPGMILKHVLVGFNDKGKKLGEVLSKNEEIQKIAAEYGFRTNNFKVFQEQAKKLNLPAEEILNIAEAPTTQVIEAMGKRLAEKIEGQ